MTRFTPANIAFSLFLLDKNTPRLRDARCTVRDEPQSNPPVWRLPQPCPHSHEDHEINIVTGGTCRYVWDEQGETRSATVSVGELFVVPGGVDHIVEVDRHATVRGLWIHPEIVAALPIPSVGETARLRSHDQPLSPRRIASLGQNTVLQEIFEQAQSEYARSGDSLQTETLRALGRLAAISLVRLMAPTGKSFVPGNQSPAGARVAAVRAFVDRNYLQEISLTQMADRASLALSQFSLLFRQLTGESPKAYLLTRRLTHVATLLENSDLPVSHIAWNTRFVHLAGFNHLFKNHYGIAPGEYRKKHQKER